MPISSIIRGSKIDNKQILNVQDLTLICPSLKYKKRINISQKKEEPLIKKCHTKVQEKMKKRQKEELLTENTPMIINPPSPIARHLK